MLNCCDFLDAMLLGDVFGAGTVVASDGDAGLEAGMARARVEQNFSLLDKDGDDRITRAEAGALAGQLFLADRDGDGVLTQAEVTAAADRIGRLRQLQGFRGKK